MCGKCEQVEVDLGRRIKAIISEIDECREVLDQMEDQKLDEKEKTIKVRYQINILKRDHTLNELINLYQNNYGKLSNSGSGN